MIAQTNETSQLLISIRTKMDSKLMQFSALFIIFVGLHLIPFTKIAGWICIAIGVYLIYKIFKTKTK
jgi:hypothetical protein